MIDILISQSHGQPYASFFSVGDRVTVTLNMDNHTLSFAKNGNPLGIAFSNLPNIPLVPAITLWNSTVVTLEN